MGSFLPFVLCVSLLGVYGSAQDTEVCMNQFDFNGLFNICTDTRFVGLREYGYGAQTFFSTVWHQGGSGGWWHFGELARVVKNQMPGTTPLLRYNDGGFNGFYAGNEPTPSLAPLNNADYVNVFIYIEEQEGTVALHRFRKGSNPRLAIQDHYEELENYGFKHERLLGYVYRPCAQLLN